MSTAQAKTAQETAAEHPHLSRKNVYAYEYIQFVDADQNVHITVAPDGIAYHCDLIAYEDEVQKMSHHAVLTEFEHVLQEEYGRFKQKIDIVRRDIQHRMASR